MQQGGKSNNLKKYTYGIKGIFVTLGGLKKY